MTAIGFGALWSLLLLGAYLGLSLDGDHLDRVRGRYPWLLLGGTALVVRLLPNLVLPEGAGYDIDSYRLVAERVLEGVDVYQDPATRGRHPYLPLQMYWMSASLALSAWSGVSFVKVVRLVPILADVLIAVVLYVGLRREGTEAAAFSGALLYALNPVAVFVSAYHGQFDAVPALFVLLGLLVLGRSEWGAGLWLGLGVWIKSWPVLAWAAVAAGLRGWRLRAQLALAATLPPLLGVGIYSLVFGVSPLGVLEQALGYEWGVGVWGYTYLLRIATSTNGILHALFLELAPYWRYLTLAGLGLVVWRVRKDHPVGAVLTVLVAFYALTHAFSVQYLVWVVPFALLAGDRSWLARYTLAAFAYMFLVYFTLIFTDAVTRLLPWPQADLYLIIPAGLPAWLVAVGWLREKLGTS